MIKECNMLEKEGKKIQERCAHVALVVRRWPPLLLPLSLVPEAPLIRLEPDAAYVVPTAVSSSLVVPAPAVSNSLPRSFGRLGAGEIVAMVGNLLDPTLFVRIPIPG